MFMWLADEGQETLRELIDNRLRELLDWTDFIEDAGVPIYLVEGYLKCERKDVTDEDLGGLARALNMNYVELFCKLKWDVSDEEIEGALQKKSKGLENEEVELLVVIEILVNRCNEILETEEMSEFNDPYNKLWDIFEENENVMLRKELAPKIADFTYRIGHYYYEQDNFLRLCGRYNDSYSFVKDFPEYPDPALACVKLAVGVFEKKFNYREFENVESYIDELVPIAKCFPDNEVFTLHAAVSLCNLLQLCPYDYSVFAGRIIEIVDQLTELSKRFPSNPELQLCYLRSLAFFLCYAKPRLIDEVYDKYHAITKGAFALNKSIVPDIEFAEMMRVLRENEISID